MQCVHFTNLYPKKKAGTAGTAGNDFYFMDWQKRKCVLNSRNFFLKKGFFTFGVRDREQKEGKRQ